MLIQSCHYVVKEITYLSGKGALDITYMHVEACDHRDCSKVIWKYVDNCVNLSVVSDLVCNQSNNL